MHVSGAVLLMLRLGMYDGYSPFPMPVSFDPAVAEHLRRELPLVVCPRLAGLKRFRGHGQHGGILALLTTSQLVQA